MDPLWIVNFQGPFESFIKCIFICKVMTLKGFLQVNNKLTAAFYPSKWQQEEFRIFASDQEIPNLSENMEEKKTNVHSSRHISIHISGYKDTRIQI